MNILFIGDVYGKPGRNVVKDILPKLIKSEKLDFVFMNGENLAHGDGITEKTILEMREIGVDAFTGGNHSFKKDGIVLYEESNYPILRPANYPPNTPGRGHMVFQVKEKKILIINLMGRVFMPQKLDCPFRKVDEILNAYQGDKIDNIFVDFHAEATSEKQAMKYHLDGRVTAVFGTHTHVQTNDLDITKKGTAYISDVGMTGIVENSVLGVSSDVIVHKFISGMDARHVVQESGEAVFSSVLIKTGTKMYAVKASFLNVKN